MKIRFIDKAGGLGLYLLSQMAQKTSRFQYDGFERFEEAFESGRPVVLTSWHGQTMMLVSMIAIHRDTNLFAVIMPDDWRGAGLKVFTDLMGGAPYPLNLEGDSTMGMGRQLLRLVKQVVGGKFLFINPDGPAGPAHVIKPGLTYIAKKANAVILPIGAYARHGYQVARWDRYMVPYPFSRISVCFGDPVTIPPETKDFTEVEEQLTKDLHRVSMQAAANYYEKRG